MTIVFYLTLFLFIFGYGLYFCNIDYDFFARLIVGKTYFQTGTLLNWDFLSYTPTHRFVDHEWGSSLIFYFLQSHFGDAGLLIFKGIIYFLTFFLITKIILLHNKNAKLHFLPFLISINVIPAILFSTVRCQCFTFFFFVLWLYVLERVRINGENRLLWILPATMLIWGNLHGGCFAGLGILFLYILGEALNKKPTKKYILALLTSVAVLIINPYGLEYLKFLVYAAFMKREFIVEWQSAFSSIGIKGHYKFIIYLFSFIILWVIYCIKNFIKTRNFSQIYNKLNKTKFLILFVTLIMAIKCIRLQPFFIFCVLAFCYNDFYEIFSKKLPEIIDKTKEIFLLAIITIFCASAIYVTKLECKLWNYPIGEIEFLKINKIKGNLMLEFHHGSYAAYRLYPDNLIFMDGKYEEVYPSNLIYMLKDINLANKNWKKNIDKYLTDIIIVSKKYKIFEELKQSPDFTFISQSKLYALFLRNELVRKDFIAPSKDMRHYTKTKYQTSIDWRKNEN